MYNLYPQFVDLNEKQEHTAILCGSCYTAVSKGHIPLHSLAGGVDFGSTLSLGLEPLLTVVEELCLAHGRPYMTMAVLNLKNVNLQVEDMYSQYLNQMKL